jgi:hypothetical protein
VVLVPAVTATSIARFPRLDATTACQIVEDGEDILGECFIAIYTMRLCNLIKVQLLDGVQDVRFVPMSSAVGRLEAQLHRVVISSGELESRWERSIGKKGAYN